MQTHTFKNFVGKKIIRILRIDTSLDYEFYTPYGIFIMIDNSTGIYFSATSDTNSIDIGVTTYAELYHDFESEDSNDEFFNGTFINELKFEDELTQFQEKIIRAIEIAQYKNESILGDNFQINLSKYAGIILKTDEHRLSFHNELGGYLRFDNLISPFPDSERWSWI